MHLPNSNIKIAEIIHKQLIGEISEKEELVLNDWLNIPENQELMEEIKNEILDGEHRIAFDSVDVETAWEKNLHRLPNDGKKNFFIAFSRIAAVIAIVFAVGSAVYFMSTPGVDPTAPMAEGIVPGEQKAQLHLADGSIVNLSDEAKEINESGALIKTNKGIVDYNSQNVPSNIMAMNTLKVPVGGEFDLKLPDGTRVKLNSKSQLRYPVSFTGDQRKVYLSGEAYFDVTHNADMPFIVATDKGIEVEVLGTSFNIMTYDDEKNLETTLVDGLVQVSINNQEFVRIKPGQQASYSKQNGKVQVKEVNTDLYTAWVDGRFVFEREELESVMRKLGRWYDLEVFYQNPAVKTKRFSANLRRYEDIDAFLSLFSMVSNVDFEVNGNSILIKERN